LNSSKAKPHFAVIGAGPAGMMAADALATSGVSVTVFEKRKSAARKLLIAGSSGLNITYEAASLDEFSTFYGSSANHILNALKIFSPQDWIQFLEKQLELPTFKGTSRRYFIEEMKAANLVRIWQKRLSDLGVQFKFGQECSGFRNTATQTIALDFSSGSTQEFDAVFFCLGGGSWEPDEKPLRWPGIFSANQIELVPFRAANVGYHVDWSKKFVEEAARKPIKNCTLTTARGTKEGEVLITEYGIEGTPVYFLGHSGDASLDLKPHLTETQVLEKLKSVRENLSPLRRVKRTLNLDPAALALLFHCSTKDQMKTLESTAALVKRFPLTLGEPRPLDEAISSSGGIAWNELHPTLELKRYPHVYVVGEMIDWNAPTGGFLIQACVSQAVLSAKAALSRI